MHRDQRSPGVRAVRVRRQGGRVRQDLVAVEEPLEIRLDGRPLVVTMRTPGHDDELAAGFLYSEGVVTRAGDIAALRLQPAARQLVARGAGGRDVCGDYVHVQLRLAPSAAAVGRARRDFRATAACGVCGKKTIEDLRQALPAITPLRVPTGLLEVLPGRLRPAQQLFDATGGIHAAGVFTRDGRLLCVREDVGRHNAVDKVIGYFLLREEVPLADRILVVSGRAGFELVQKALKAAVPVMVSVGAASSLAIDMATRAGMTLYSFAGRGRGNLHVGFVAGKAVRPHLR